MKKLTVAKVTVSVMLLASQSGLAEFSSYSNGFKRDIGAAESAISSLTGKKIGSSQADSLNSTQAKAEKAATDLESQEAEEKSKLQNWVQKNESLKSVKAMPDLVVQKAIEKRQLDLDRAESLAAQLGQASLNTSAQFNNNNLSKECRKGVDKSQIQSLLDQMNSDPGTYLKRTASKLIDEKRTSLKQKQQEKLLAALKYFKELSQKEESPSEKLLNSEEASDKSIEERIAELKAHNQAQKKLNKELSGNLVDSVFSLASQVGEIKENDKRVGFLAAEVVKMVTNLRNQLSQRVQEVTSQLLANCDEQQRSLFNDIMVSQSWMVRGGISAQVAQLDTQAQFQRAQQLQCDDVSDRVQAIVSGAAGSAINARLSTLSATKDPGTLVAEAVLVTQDVANMGAQIAEELKPLEEQCEDMVNSKKAVEQRIQPLMAQQSNSSVGGVPRFGSTLGSSASNPFSGSSHGRSFNGSSPRRF